MSLSIYNYDRKNKIIMFSRNIKNNSEKFKSYSSEKPKTLDDCEVSKASNEIMLDRFYDGKSIEFPFAQ